MGRETSPGGGGRYRGLAAVEDIDMNERFSFKGETPEWTACFLAGIGHLSAEEAEKRANDAIAILKERADARAKKEEAERLAAEQKVLAQKHYLRNGERWTVVAVKGWRARLETPGVGRASGTAVQDMTSVRHLAAATTTEPCEDGFIPAPA